MLVVASLFIFFHAINAHSVEMGTCRMVCDDASVPGPSIRGTPGKKGPPGIKGEMGSVGPVGQKGEAADPCVCPEENALQNRIEELEARLKRINAPKDCTDVVERRESYRGGVYTIYPYPTKEKGVKVYCDTKTDDGGWIVFQRRMDGSEDFFRGWDDYVNGFGNFDGEFWLGLDRLHELLQTGDYELRVDLEDFENNTAYAKYSSFKIGGAETYFNLTTLGYSGTAGNNLAITNIGFSTKDQDHDTNESGSCATYYKGAWWYTKCHSSNLNGLYLRGEHESYANSVIWHGFKEYYYSLKFSEMKIRKKTE